MNQTYVEYQAAVKADQENLTKDEIIEQMSSRTEYAIDLDSLPKQKHNWVERGIKVSCEGANHPYHSHFLVKR